MKTYADKRVGELKERGYLSPAAEAQLQFQMRLKLARFGIAPGLLRISVGLEDVRDLFAHVKTLPAVQDKSKPHDVPFPFNIRRSLGGWKFLFLDGQVFKPDAAKDAVWNRGAYKGTYARFHAAIKAGMDARQTPNLFTMGPAAAFVKEQPFAL